MDKEKIRLYKKNYDENRKKYYKIFCCMLTNAEYKLVKNKLKERKLSRAEFIINASKKLGD